jgi:tRNA A-37 threonylcarbamoyl transferase component Bud32
MLNRLANLVRSRRQVWHSRDWTTFVGEDWPRRLLDAELTDRLHRKQGRSIARWTVTNAAGRASVFVKRHYRHSLLRTLFGYSDAVGEWHHLRRAESLGVPVPRALAVAEWSSGPGRLQSAIVLEELAGMIPLHEAIPLAAKIMSPVDFERWKAGLIAELVRLTRRLHDNGFCHRDLYLCHFFIPEHRIAAGMARFDGEIVLIDFHRLARPRLWPMLGRAKDLAQLLYSARLPGVTRRDVLRFWRLYRGTHRQPMLRRLAVWKASRYEAHNGKGSGA